LGLRGYSGSGLRAEGLGPCHPPRAVSPYTALKLIGWTFDERVVLHRVARLRFIVQGAGPPAAVTARSFESLILSHHSRYKVTCECNVEEINDDDDDDVTAPPSAARRFALDRRVESGPLGEDHLPRHKWPGGLVRIPEG